MATSKPISTISYNTEAFLKEKLDTWVKSHLIMSYMYICHKGEDGDKDHIHLRIEPNKPIDKMDLMEALQEYPIGTDFSKKPLGVRPFRPSKEEDWILYAVHDSDYLKGKYEENKGEKLPYKWEDIKAPDYFDVETAYIRAKAKLERTNANIVKRIRNGESGQSIIETGVNPYQFNAVVRAMQTTEYQKVAYELTKTQERLDSLIKAVNDLGYSIDCDQDGNIELVKVDPKTAYQSPPSW